MGGSSGSTTQSTSQASNQQGAFQSSPEQWMDQLAQYVGQQGAGTFQGTMNQANNIQGNSGNMVNQGNQLTGTAGNMMQGAYNQAQGASQYNPATMQSQFMNPYTQNVVNQNAAIAQRDFNQQTAPSLMGQFGASGQFDSGRADQAMGMASAQNQANVNQINAGLMNQGYQQSQQNYLASMGIGVQGANAMTGAGSGAANVGQNAYNQGMGQLLAPGQVFGTYSGALGQLPYGSQGTSQQSTNQAGTANVPQQSLF